MTNSLEPLEPPARLWSFNQEDCQGGTLREYYPAAGFRTKAGVTVGLLTDSGYRNHWSRIIRRDGKPLKPALLQIPHVNLNYVPRAGKPTVQQTFGEALVQSENQNASEVISLPAVPLWQKQGEVDLEERDGSTVLSLKSTDAAVLIPFPAKDGEVYSLRLEYRSAQAFAMQLLDVDRDLHKLENVTLYDDRIPESPTGWSEFRTTAFFTQDEGAEAPSLSPRRNPNKVTNSKRWVVPFRSNSEFSKFAASRPTISLSSPRNGPPGREDILHFRG